MGASESLKLPTTTQMSVVKPAESFPRSLLGLDVADAGLVVCLENLLNSCNVDSCAQVETKVVAHSDFHDGAGRSLHGVGQTTVNNVLLRSARNAPLELLGWGNRDLTASTAKLALK